MTEITKMDPATMEKVVVGGDLSQLTPQQRLSYYAARCEAAGLDPRARPFQYLQLQGKLVLYADKGCADQLCASRALTVQIVDRRAIGDCYEVHVRVTRHGGTSVDDVGVVSIGTLKGEALCNAIMKAVTKAKRRAILSACGLGMLDDSEIETIRDARRVDFDEAPPPALSLPPVPALHVDAAPAQAPGLPPVPALPPPSALPKGDEMAAISSWLVRIQGAQDKAELDQIRAEMNTALKRRTKAQTEAIKAALAQRTMELAEETTEAVIREGEAEHNALLAVRDALSAERLDEIRAQVAQSAVLTDEQKRVLFAAIQERRQALAVANG